MPRVLIVGCSNSINSLNNKLAKEISDSSGFDSLFLVKYKNIPILSKDILEKSGFPEDIKKLCGVIKEYEVLLFVSPEHNGYFPAFFKNILDWISLKDRYFLDNKRVYLSSASKTLKTKRLIDTAASITFSLFKCSSYSFINFCNYAEDKGEDKKKINELIMSLKN